MSKTRRGRGHIRNTPWGLWVLVVLAFVVGFAKTVPFTPLDGLIFGFINALIWWWAGWLFIIIWRLGKRALARFL